MGLARDLLADGVPESELSEEFFRGMAARMIMGVFQGMADRMSMSFWKYGAVKDTAIPDRKIDYMESMLRRLELYKETGNTEHLIDAANFLGMEFMYPGHPDAHFEGTDSDASPGRKWVGGDFSAERNVKPVYSRPGD